jgi:hypothetical protein
MIEFRRATDSLGAFEVRRQNYGTRKRSAQ